MKRTATLILGAAMATGFIANAQHAIYVENNTGWSEFHLYAWATGETELFGGWPGATGTATTVGGVQMLKFETAADFDGKTYNLIANNNAALQYDGPAVTLDKDYYFTATAEAMTEIVAPGAETHTLYVLNEGTFNPLYAYAWGTSEIFGGWPGKQAVMQEIDGNQYSTFTFEAADEGTGNVIFNNGSGGDGNQFDAAAIPLNKDTYGKITADNKWEEMAAPGAKEYNLYIENNTGWDALYVYAWGDAEVFGGWPGAKAETTTDKDGKTYYVIPYMGNGEALNLIFNNNAALQYDAATITGNSDYTFVAGADSATETSAVSAVEMDGQNAEVIWFNLQGQRVQNPGQGIFIKVSNGNSSKVRVK